VKISSRTGQIIFGASVALLIFFSGRSYGQTTIPTTGLRLWLSADTGVTADQNGLISVWQDQSGFANNASQSTSSNQPLLVLNSVAGLPVVHFSGNQWLTLPDLMNGAPAGEIFLVLKATADVPTSARGLMSFGNGYEDYYPWNDGQIYENFGSSVRYTVGNPSPLLDQYHLFRGYPTTKLT
jgi:hypothetical protein